MIGYLTLILGCQLAGETVVSMAGLPVPGPVLGMVLLFIFLMLRGAVPAQLSETTNGLLGAMSLLFVPAGTGVILHFKLLGEAMVPLGLALVVSTALTTIVTGLMMRWLARPVEAQDG